MTGQIFQSKYPGSHFQSDAVTKPKTPDDEMRQQSQAGLHLSSPAVSWNADEPDRVGNQMSRLTILILHIEQPDQGKNNYERNDFQYFHFSNLPHFSGIASIPRGLRFRVMSDCSPKHNFRSTQIVINQCPPSGVSCFHFLCLHLRQIKIIYRHILRRDKTNRFHHYKLFTMLC
jgi:hypothetical protein